MLPQFYLKTKLLPPRLGRRVLARPRLLDRMRSFLDRPATIVSANAGCGKTTLVAHFVRSSNLPSVWYQIDASDLDLAVFFGYLVSGLRGLNPDFGQVALGFISETEGLASKTDQLVDIFLNEVSQQLEQKTIIVLDDYHQVDSSQPIAAAVDRLLQYLPDVLHIVITSRSMPNLSVTRLRSKGLVGVLDRRDLLFTEDEVRQLFAETFALPLPPEQVNQFHEKTEGWVTALQLIQQSLERLSEPERSRPASSDGERDPITAALRHSEIDIFDYFAEEVLEFEQPETRLMLGRLSLVERIDPAICDAALGISSCAEQLRALARRNVFISHTYISGAEEEYRLHPLFRSFLARWLASQIGAEEVSRLHRECAAYFVRSRRWDFAVHHYTEAGAADEVAGLIAEHGSDLVRSGRFETIKRAFERLPKDALAGRPRSLITRADVALIEGDTARALDLYTRAGQMARAAGKTEAEAEALRGQAYIARYRGDAGHAIRLATSALDLAPGLHSLRARCFNILGLCYFTSLHDGERAIENWREALEEARLADDDRLTRIVLHNLGLPYSTEGDFNEALRWLSQMIEPRADAQAPFPQEAIAHLNIARLKTVQGRLDEAQSHLTRALDRCQLFNLKTATAETFEAYGNLYRERGEYGKALEFYDEAARAYRDAGLQPTDKELLDERATLYLRMGETEKAEREAEEYYRARSEGTPSERSTALITRGRIEMAASRAPSAERLLAEAAEISRGGGLHYNETRAEASLARLFWEAGRYEEAFERLGRAAELSRRYDYSYWLAGEAAASEPLFRAAIDARVAPGYLSQIVPQAQARPKSQESAAARPALHVELIIERPSYDLAINMLGPVEVYRDPTTALKEAWRLSKSLHMLCYIASRRNRRATKDALVDLFWGDADPDSIAKNFHPTVSHMRKALNAGQVVKKDFVLYREGAYSLNPQYQYRIDTEEFERLVEDAREARRNGDEEGAAQLLGEAIKLYRGDFLEEVYYNWVDEVQSYYSDLYLGSLKELIEYHSGRGHHEPVIRYGQMILQRDAYQEDVHCQVMEAHVRSGNRAAAIEQFDGLRKMLRRELGVDPLPATIARYEALIK
jgi:ATP/maltotriose-dependent transcriptional regulator MalT/two-component SAPR family response regulator